MSSHSENVAAYRGLPPEVRAKADRLIAEQRQIRDGLIANAVETRKIAPDRAEDFKRMYDTDPKGITHLLSAPVEHGGLMAGNAAVHNPLPPPPPDGYPAEWLGSGSPSGQVTFEDGGTAPQAVAGALPTAAPAEPSRITLEPGL